MERAEHHVSRFRRTEARADSIHVAHFTHENHVGIFTQRTAKGIGEGEGIPAHHALRDDTFFIRVYEFDGIFGRDYVGLTVFVDEIHHSGQGGGLATTRNAADQEKPPVLPAHVFYHFG